MSQEFSIVGNLLLKVDGAEAGLNKLKNSLSKLEMPKGLENSFKKSFSSLDDIFVRYKKQLEKGFDTKADVSNITKIGKELDSELTKVSNHLTKLTGEKVDFKIDTAPVKQATKDLEDILEKKRQLVQEKLEFKIESPKEGIDNIKQLLQEFQRVTGDTKAGRAAGNALFQLETGDIEKAISFLREAENNLNRIGDKKKEAFSSTGFTFGGALETIIKELETTDGELATVSDKAKLFQDILAQAQAGQLKDVDALLEKISQGFTKNASSAREAAKAAQDYAQSTVSMKDQVKQLQQSTQYFFSLRNMINLFKRGIREAVDTVKELDKAMTETAVVTKYSVGDMWAKLPEYTANANALGATVQDMYESTTLYYQQGLNTQQAMGIATETMKMARIAGLEAADATDMMTAALRGFNMEINEASAQRINDVYSQLAAKTASNTEELGTAMQRTASIAHSAGMSFEGTAAFLAQAIETTREPAENLGTAMKTIVARFQELKKNPLEITDVDGEEVSYNKVDTALKTIGVDLKDTNGQFRDLDKVFLDISQKWDGLSQTQQRYIATTAAGSRQQSRFIAMMSDYNRTMELMGYANNSAGASTTQFNKTLDSLEAKINKFQNAWKQFLMGIMNDSWTKKVVDAGTSVLNVVNKIIDTLSIGGRLKGVKSILSTLTAFTALKMAGRGANALIGGLGGMVDPRSSMLAGMRQGALGGRQAANAAQAQMIYQPIVNELRAIRQLQGQQLTQENRERIGAYDQYNKFKDSRAFLTGLTKGGKAFSLQDIQQSLFGLNANSQNILMRSNAGTAYTLTKGILGNYAGRDGYNKNIAAGIKNAERFWNTQRKSGANTWEEYFGAISDPRLLKQGIDKTIGNGKYNPAYEFLDRLDKKISIAASQNTSSSEVMDAFKARYKELAKAGVEDIGAQLRKEGWAEKIKAENQRQRQKIIQEDQGSFKNSNAARALNTIGQVGAGFSQVGMGLQAFGNILTSSANPALQMFGTAINTIGGVVSGMGMAISGISSGFTALASSEAMATIGTTLFGGSAMAASAVLLGIVALLGVTAFLIKKHNDNIKKEAEEITTKYKDKSSENQSNLANLRQWKNELAVLSKGVDENGYNISLDTADYDHYLEIVDGIAKINPEIVQGYNAQGHAIIDNNKALEETLALEEKRGKELLRDYTSPDSLTKLLKARNLQRNRVAGGGRAGQPRIETIEYELKPRTEMRREATKIGKELQRNSDLIDLSKLNINIDELASGSEAEFQKVLDNYDVFKRLVSESIDRAGDEWNDKSKEAIEKSLSSFEEYGSDLDELVQPVYEALSASASQTSGFKEMANNIKTPFQKALKELATNGEFEDGREIDKAARNMATKFAGYSEAYIDAMEKVNEANKQFALDFDEGNYKELTEDAISELEALKSTLEDTPEGHAISQWVDSEIHKIQNHLSTGTKSIEEAWDTISDKISVAESELENFNKKTEKDFYSASDDMKKIFDTVMDEDAYHVVGRGDKTFWAGAESLLGSDNIMNKTKQEVYDMMTAIEPFLTEGPEGAQKFDERIKEVSKDLDKIKGVEMEDGWFKSIDENVNPEAWKQIADYLGMSEELLTSLINKSRQFHPWDFSDMESIREAYAMDDTVIHGTKQASVTTANENGKETTVQADTLYITDAELRERMGEEYYQQSAREDKVEALSAQGIEVLPEHLDQLTAQMMKNEMGIKDWNSAIQTFGDTGRFEKDEIYEAAKTLAKEEQGEKFNEEEFRTQFNEGWTNWLESYENPTLEPMNSIADNMATTASDVSAIASKLVGESAADKNTDEESNNSVEQAIQETPDKISNSILKAEEKNHSREFDELTWKDMVPGWVSSIVEKTETNEPQTDPKEIAKASAGETTKQFIDTIGSLIHTSVNDKTGYTKTTESDTEGSSDLTTASEATTEAATELSGVANSLTSAGNELNTAATNLTSAAAILVSSQSQSSGQQTAPGMPSNISANTESSASGVIVIDNSAALESLAQVESKAEETKGTIEKGATFNVSVKDSGLRRAAKQATKITKTPSDKNINISAKTKGLDDVQTLTSAVKDFKALGNDSVSLSVNVSGTSDAWSAVSAVKEFYKLNNDTVTITTIKETITKNKATGSHNHGYAPAPSFGSAARGSYGQVGPKGKGGLTLTGELGYEVAWIPSENRSMILGANGPQMINLPGDAVVWNHEQSKRILKQGSIPAGSAKNTTTATSKSTADYSDPRNTTGTGKDTRSTSGRDKSRNSGNNNNNNIKEQEKLIKKAGKVTVWWENQARKVDAIQRKADKALNGFKTLISNGNMTLKKIKDAIGNDYIKNLQASTARSQESYNRASAELNLLDKGSGKGKATTTYKTVKKGSKNKTGVKTLQKDLIKAGYGKGLKADGKFGNQTAAALKKFQKEKKLNVTGKADKKTIQKLAELGYSTKGLKSTKYSGKKLIENGGSWANISYQLTKKTTKKGKTKTSKETKESKVDLSKYIKEKDGTYVIDQSKLNKIGKGTKGHYKNSTKGKKAEQKVKDAQKALDRAKKKGNKKEIKEAKEKLAKAKKDGKKYYVKGTKGNKSKAEAIKNAAESEINKRLDRQKKAEDDMIKNHEAEVDYYNQLEDAFHGWRNELTKVYAITNEIEKTEARISKVKATRDLEKAKFETLDLSRGMVGAGDNFASGLKAIGKAYREEGNLLDKQAIQLKDKQGANEAELKSALKLSSYEKKAAKEAEKAEKGKTIGSTTVYDALSETEKDAYAKKFLLNNYLQTNFDGTHTFDSEALAKDIEDEKITGEFGERLKKSFDYIAELEKQGIDLETEATNNELEQLNLKEEEKQYYQDIADQLYGWKNTLTEILELTTKIEQEEKHTALLKQADDYYSAKRKAGYGDEVDSTEVLKTYVGQMASNITAIQDRNKLIEELRADLQSSITGEGIAKELANARAAFEEDPTNEVLKAELENLEKEATYVQDMQKYLTYTPNADGTFNIDFHSEQLEEDKLKNGGSVGTEYYNKIEERAQEIINKNNELAENMAANVTSVTDLYNSLAELKQIYVERAKELREAYGAQQQKIVDNIKTLYGAIDNNFKELISSVRDSIQQRRQAEDNAKTEQDISKKQQRLAMLRADTSGGNKVEIAQLQQEISDAQQAYGRTLEDQMLDKVSKQGDEAAKQRQRQIDLLQAQRDIAYATGEDAKKINDWLNNPEQHEKEIAEVLKGDSWSSLTEIEKQNLSAELDDKLGDIKELPGKIDITEQAIKLLGPDIQKTEEQISLSTLTAIQTATGAIQDGLTTGLSSIGGNLETVGTILGTELNNTKDTISTIEKNMGEAIKKLQTEIDATRKDIQKTEDDKKAAEEFNELKNAIIENPTTANWQEALDKIAAATTKWDSLTDDQKALTNFDNKDEALKRANAAKTQYEQEEAKKQRIATHKNTLNSYSNKLTNAYNDLLYAQGTGNGSKISTALHTFSALQSEAQAYTSTHNELPEEQYANFLFNRGNKVDTGNQYWDSIKEKGLKNIFDIGSQMGLEPGQVAWDLAKTEALTWRDIFKAAIKAGYTKEDVKPWRDYVTTDNGKNSFGKAYNTEFDVKSGEKLITNFPIEEGKKKKYEKYITGGLNKRTGPAWLDGTPSKPELVLNAKDTQNFLALRDVLSKAMNATNSVTNSYGGDAMYEININVDHLSSDYDVDRVVEKVKKEIVKGSGYRNVTQVRNFR